MIETETLVAILLEHKADVVIETRGSLYKICLEEVRELPPSQTVVILHRQMKNNDSYFWR